VIILVNFLKGSFIDWAWDDQLIHMYIFISFKANSNNPIWTCDKITTKTVDKNKHPFSTSVLKIVLH